MLKRASPPAKRLCFVASALFIVLVPQLLGQQIRSPQTPKRDWGPEQATGAADTLEGGDAITSWAPATIDGGDEWLQLDFASAAVPARIKVYENWNPGAVFKVSVFNTKGVEVEAWQGTDPTPRGTTKGVSEIPLQVDGPTKRVKIYLNTKPQAGIPEAKPQFNEIDAVELIDTSGKSQWATGASSSSSFADTAHHAPAPMPIGYVAGHGAWGHGYDDGSAPQFGLAQVEPDGSIRLVQMLMKPVFETQYLEVVEERTVTRDGKQVKENVTKKVPRIAQKIVPIVLDRKVPASSVTGYETDGSQVAAAAIAARLKQFTPTVHASASLPNYYLDLFKKGTLVLVTPPPSLYGPPPPIHGANGAAGERPEEKINVALPSKQPPQLFLAMIEADGRMRFRHYSTNSKRNTLEKNETRNGVMQSTTFDVEFTTIKSDQWRIDHKLVGVFRADGREVDRAGLKQGMSKERSVLVSADGDKLDPFYLQFVKAEAPLLIPPPNSIGMSHPAMMPAPMPMSAANPPLSASTPPARVVQ